MKIYEIGTGYTPVPARMGAATEIVVECLTRAFAKQNLPVEIMDIKAENRAETDLPIQEVWVPGCFSGTDVQLGLQHKLKRVVYSLCLTAKLQKLLKNTQEEIVLHFHNQYNLFFFLRLTPARLRKKALIAYTVHSGIWRQEWEKIEKTVKRRYFQEAFCMKRADIVLLFNAQTKQNAVVQLGVAPERIVMTGNGVDTAVYCPLEYDTRDMFGFGGKKVILQVGSVNENKGQLRTVQQLLPLLRADQNLVYAYAGGIVDVNYHEQVQTLAKEHGLTEQIRYLGMMAPGTQLNALYNAAAVTVFPSVYEAFGLVAIESMAAGVPVLVDRSSGMDFGAGCIAYDAANFPDIIKSLLTQQAEPLREAARSNAINHYSWDAVAAKHAEAFRNRMKPYV